MGYYADMERESVKKRFEACAPLLDERRRRLYAAVEATTIGEGGFLRFLKPRELLDGQSPRDVKHSKPAMLSTISSPFAEREVGVTRPWRRILGSRKPWKNWLSQSPEAIRSPPCGGRVKAFGWYLVNSRPRAKRSVIMWWPSSSTRGDIVDKRIARRKKARLIRIGMGSLRI
jgi:hypothetical protein